MGKQHPYRQVPRAISKGSVLVHEGFQFVAFLRRPESRFGNRERRIDDQRTAERLADFRIFRARVVPDHPRNVRALLGDGPAEKKETKAGIDVFYKRCENLQWHRETRAWVNGNVADQQKQRHYGMINRRWPL